MEFRMGNIMGGIGVLIGAGALVFFLFFWNEHKKEVPPNDIPIGNFPQANDFSGLEDNTSYHVGFRDVFMPVIRPLKPAVSYIEGVFSDEMSATETSPVVSLDNEPRNNQLPVLSEEQIFDTIWPESYRDALGMLQDMMVKDGFILATEKRAHITSDDDIYATLLTIASYAVKQGWTESADFDQLQVGIQELERVVARERTNLRMTGKVSTGALLPGGQRIDKTPYIKQGFFSMIIDGLKYSLTVGEADAASSGWHTTPDCYKDLAPNPSPGISLWIFCCNCGCRYAGYTCVYVPDCGPGPTPNKLCDIPFGCLNLICEAWPNAVWDAFWNPPPGTGICGCG